MNCETSENLSRKNFQFYNFSSKNFEARATEDIARFIMHVA